MNWSQNQYSLSESKPHRSLLPILVISTMNRHNSQYQPTNPFQALSGVQRYGFNGMERETNISSGCSDFEERAYSSNLARFLSIDPLSKESPWSSSYSFAANKPIFMVDLHGLKGTIYIQVMLDKSGKPTIDKKTMSAVLKDLKKQYNDLGIDLNVEVKYSNSIFTKDDFYKREGADATDSYIVIGTLPQLVNVAQENRSQNRGWDNVWVTEGAHGRGKPRSINGTSTETGQYFSVVDSENVQKIGHFEEYRDVVNKISVTVQHETMHPKMMNHPGMRSDITNLDSPKGQTGHVPQTIMAQEPSRSQVYDMYMVQELRKIHGASVAANICVEDTPNNRSTCYGNYQRMNSNLTKEQVIQQVDAITTWVKPTNVNSRYSKSDTKKISNEKH
jgi:RHS repeat-associated protein